LQNVQINDRPKISDVNILYLLCMGFFVIGGEIIRIINPPSLSYGPKMLLITATQLLFVFLPVAAFIYIKKINIKSCLRIKRISFTNLLISCGIMIFAIPITAFLNFIAIFILKYYGKLHSSPIFPSETLLQLMINLTVIAVVPALFEELLCRGVIMRAYESTGRMGAILISSLFFALLHRDLQSFIGTFLLGVVIAYIVYKTDSIFAGMAAHFTNNGLVIILTFVLFKIQELIRDTFPDFAQQIERESQNANIYISTEQMITTFLLLGGIAFFCSIAFTGLILLLNHTTKDITKSIDTTTYIKHERVSYLPLIVSFGLVIYSYYLQLI